MVNSKKRIIVMLSFLALLFIFVIGISYAYYAANVIGNLSDDPSLKLTSGYLSMVYEGGDTSITGGSTEGTTNDLVYTKNFTITNDGVADSNFGIWIKNYKVKDKNGIDTTLTRPEDWTYILKSGNTIIKSGTFVTEDEAIISVYPLNMEETIPLTLTLTYNYITAEEGGTDQTADMGKVLSFDIVVVQSIDNLKNTSEGTLLYAINNQYQANIIRNASDLITIPGQAANLSTEAIIATTEDDYGTSYYYRGNVENNYVTYSNMCWRIVRIQGDGTIKLALADGAHPCGTANGYSATDTDSAFVADESGNARNDIAYKASAAYDATDFPFANSDIPLVLSIWAENKNLDMSQLVEAEWCNDTAHTGINNTEKTYGAHGRLFPVDSAEPSLKCNTKGMEGSTGTEAKAIRYKNVLGILSADEVAFAGSNANDEPTYDYYLRTNASRNWYWTLSPSNLRTGSHSYVWSVFSGGLDYGDLDIPNGSVRPAVVLRSDVTIQDGGNGTIDKPYVIE